ncbi:hypothetical protein CEUSTIGMA_g10428.t1 [Chlamydomonas eustigma]|uniref:TF-B3 domain-containing protein n=1 Tax=Chlamydomonas eustigma TaxID=1157962 RepID=A0A250XIU0_9CHLO|nr:hypothetical protein CEUSTIGMA_g10428.t1 [Chlamydomonas eustigma]|eukprot:GAX83001.1 hypothetical protein CEUSTIGMA_g10428.t1 [Chlamydomonas eustigma]
MVVKRIFPPEPTLFSNLIGRSLQNQIAMAEANGIQLQESLNRSHLLKRMNKSHISGGFWLGGFGSTSFRDVLPNTITDLALEHRGEHWPVRWLVENAGMSGGWKAFAKDHALVEADYVLFEKKDETTLKVYIFRQRDYEEGKTPDLDPYFEDAECVDFKSRKVLGLAKVKKEEDEHQPKKVKKVSIPAATGYEAEQHQGLNEAGPSVHTSVTSSIAGEERSTPQVDPSSIQARLRAKVRSSSLAIPRDVTKIDSSKMPKGITAALQKKTAASKEVPETGGPKISCGGIGKVNKIRSKAQKPLHLKSKKQSIWEYEFTGKAAEYAKILRDKYKEIMRDTVTVEKKTGAILSGLRAGMYVHGYGNLCWEYVDGKYRPVHVVHV